MTSRRSQRDQKPDDSRDHSFAALESELHAARKPNRQDKRAVERTASRAEAEGFARVTNQHYRGGITG